MKKLFVASALALFGAVHAQVNYGVKAGYNLSNVAVSSPVSSAKVLLGNKSGYSVGGFVEYGIGSGFSLQGEVLYSNLGAKATVDSNKLPSTAENYGIDFNMPEGVKKAEINFSVNQITVPLSAKYTFNDKFGVLGGVGINFVTGRKLSLKADGNDVTKFFEQNGNIVLNDELKKQISSTNFTLHVGADYRITQNVFVDVRYNFGISSLNQNFTDFVSAKQRYFQFGVGYKF